jgi:hypothetical protein
VIKQVETNDFHTFCRFAFSDVNGGHVMAGRISPRTVSGSLYGRAHHKLLDGEPAIFQISIRVNCELDSNEIDESN